MPAQSEEAKVEPRTEPAAAEMPMPVRVRDALVGIVFAHYGRGAWWEALPSAERLGLDPGPAQEYTKAPPVERAKLLLKLAGDSSEPMPAETAELLDLAEGATYAQGVRKLRASLSKE